MKILSGFFVVFFIICSLFIFCGPAGSTTELIMNNDLLPEELKGLKIYSINDGNDNYIKVAVLKSGETSTAYRSGKTTNYCLTTNLESSITNIPIKEIISENDSIIVAKKY